MLLMSGCTTTSFGGWDVPTPDADKIIPKSGTEIIKDIPYTYSADVEVCEDIFREGHPDITKSHVVTLSSTLWRNPP